jgi:hypothetical protein
MLSYSHYFVLNASLCRVVRKFKRGFGAMVREVIFCTGARSVTAEDILHPTVANLCDWKTRRFALNLTDSLDATLWIFQMNGQPTSHQRTSSP